MIDINKIKQGDEVQIANGDWYPVGKIGVRSLAASGIFIVNLFEKGLITDHRPAEPVVPKGEGIVDGGKDAWILLSDGQITPIYKIDAPYFKKNAWKEEISQGSVSNNYEQLVQERDRRAIKQELMECDGAVVKPVVSICAKGIKSYVGVDRFGRIDFAYIQEHPYAQFICSFINIEAAKGAIEKVGAERIRKAWGVE